MITPSHDDGPVEAPESGAAFGQEWPRRVAILGVGLLGGSVALAVRRIRPQTTFIGYSRTPGKLDQALGLGVIDQTSDSIAEACRDCDVVVVATPVDRIAPLVVEAAGASPPTCLITDVGSTKAKILADVAKHPQAARKFVAAHPIAGSEKSGNQHAVADLLDGKIVVLTANTATDPAWLARAERFWTLTGGSTCWMSGEDHDAHLAAISHVPHLVSALVARMVPPQARSLVGSGWRDITRVAAGDPEMWTAICQENRQAICQELQRLSEELTRLQQIISQSQDEALTQWLGEAKRVKEQS